MTYPSIALSKESLEMLNMYLNSKKTSRIIYVLDVIWNLVERHDSNEDVKSYVLDSVSCLFSFIRNQKSMTVYENTLLLLLFLRRKRHTI
jgi:hypothetical protein